MFIYVLCYILLMLYMFIYVMMLYDVYMCYDVYVHCHIIVNNPVLVSPGRSGGSWSKGSMGAPASSKSSAQLETLPEVARGHR